MNPKPRANGPFAQTWIDDDTITAPPIMRTRCVNDPDFQFTDESQRWFDIDGRDAEEQLLRALERLDSE